MNSFLHTYAHQGMDLQRPAAAAVVIPTILRPVLADALRSVFAQTLRGRIHVLIGIDVPNGDPDLLTQLCAARPENVIVQVFYPGYSTSSRHGGLSPAGDGGVLRTVLTYLANSPFVAYLDDDNWWHPDHLRLMRAATATADWAYALRWFVDPVSRQPICIDEWESVGPDQGVYREDFGGFVDPSCLMLNKLRCPLAIPQWRRPLVDDGRNQSSDRSVFRILCQHYRGAATGLASVFYQLDPHDPNHQERLGWMRGKLQTAGA